MPQPHSSDAPSWKRVWKLYRDHRAVFDAVFGDLRRRGTVVTRDEATELLHEFLLEQAPYALRTFDPERGQLDQWLFVVFRRFVLGRLQTHRRQARLVTALHDVGHEPPGPSSESEQPGDLEAARCAIAELPAPQRHALLALLEPSGSVREVARRLGTTRWRARRLVVLAVASVALALDVDVGLEREDLELLVASEGDPSIVRAAAAAGVAAEQAHAAVRRVHHTLMVLLGISRPTGGRDDE